MKVLVAGAAGFIGSNLCKQLLAEGHEVIGIDNFYTSDGSNIKDVAEFKGNNFHLYEMDIRHFDPELEIKILNGNFDVIYNMACPADVPVYQKDPIYTHETSIDGIRSLISLCHEDTLLIQASTSEVYGDSDRSPQNEDYRGNVSITGPRACYDEGKRMAETILSDYRRVHGLRYRTVRIFNTYGPGMNPNDQRVITNFIRQTINGDPLTVYGDGSQTRSFCYITDQINFLMELGVRNYDRKEIDGQVFNYGNPNEFTILELAEALDEAFNRYSMIRYEDLPIHDPLQRRPDISKAKITFGDSITPKVELREGLLLMREYMTKKLKRIRNGN